MKKGFFEGWYLKHQIGERVFAFIVSFHENKSEDGYANIQLITNEGAFSKRFQLSESVSRIDQFAVKVGRNSFSKSGCKIAIDFDGFVVNCNVKYGQLTPLEKPIMGPFRHLKFLECNHEVLSMTHTLSGYLEINGNIIELTGGVGYIEKDKGHSFPKEYLWTQCNFRNHLDNSIMLAIAKVPIGPVQFNGVIAEIFYSGKHYRLATYHGVKIKQKSSKSVILVQGGYKLRVQRIEEPLKIEIENEKDQLENIIEPDIKKEGRFALDAPRDGDMNFKIYESPSCKIRYTFYDGEKKKFDFVSRVASYEYYSQLDKVTENMH